MTKVISLSNEAYQTLKQLKKSGEAFSDVVLRVAGKRKKEIASGVFRQMGNNDIDEVFLQVRDDRERLVSS